MKPSHLPKATGQSERADRPESLRTRELAAYRRPLLRSHGPLSTLTAKSGDVVKPTALEVIPSDVNLKENVVHVAWG